MKKFLSLVLALVMTMSLVTVSAGAKDFTDDGDITYDEAVAVMSAVGVIDGYTDGSFQPTTNLTRGAAAKIICNLILGPTTASALGADTAPYSDVPVTNTFAGYIAYCQKEGIISGYADGTFRPSAPLTGYAFMKMLLGALGYDSAKEGYTGANWSVNVAKQAIAIGLDDGNDEFVGQASVNREEAMLYAFNTMQATMVEYPNDTTIVSGDLTISTSGKATKVENNSKTEGYIDDDGYMQFAEQYFTKLEKLTKNEKDVLGRPAHTWEYDDETVGTYADEADEIYVVDDADLDIETVVTGGSYMNYSDSEFKDTKDFWFNGDNSAEKTTELNVGDIVEVFEDDGDVGTVVVSHYVAAKIDEVDDDLSTTETKNGASVELSITSLNGKTDMGNYYDAYKNDEGILRGYTSDYKEGTVLAVIRKGVDADGDILASYIAESETGKVTAYKADSTITLDGTKYTFADVVDGDTDNFDFDEEYVIYMTADGYVIGVDGATGADLDDVYYVFGVYGEQSKYSEAVTYYAVVASLEDGTVSEVKVDKSESGDLGDVFKTEDDGFQKVKANNNLFTIDGDEVKAWKNSKYIVDPTALSDDASVSDTRIKTDSFNYYVDDTTRYLGIDDTDMDDIGTTYAQGGMKASDGSRAIVICNESETRDAVYVVYVDASASTGSEDLVYVAKDNYDTIGKDKYESSDIWFMNGVKSEEIVLDKDYDAGYFYTYEIEDDVYKLTKAPKQEISDATVDKDSEGWLTDLDLTNTNQIYRDALTGKIGGKTFDDVDMANAKIVDTRSTSAINGSAYDKTINSISRLTAAIEDAGNVTVDIYVDDGAITFVAVTAVAGRADSSFELSGYSVAMDADSTDDSITVTKSQNVVSYAVTSNKDQVSAEVKAGKLEITTKAGFDAEATLTVTATTDDGEELKQEVTVSVKEYTLTLPEALEVNDMTATLEASETTGAKGDKITVTMKLEGNNTSGESKFTVGGTTVDFNGSYTSGITGDGNTITVAQSTDFGTADTSVTFEVTLNGDVSLTLT